ncbi:MAG TPA: type I-C CRISPR-associated protein Cas5c [Gemmataceae bacterium]|nr:type I-C CRISPR-associated protein Cas5c [Gemmataceae bacterium]
MTDFPPVAVKAWGERACFTRPEMKVERVSYPVITPSAARGVLEAIFWKPEFIWQVREIWVLKPIRHFSMVRNEVNSVASEKSARAWAQAGGGYFADEDRAQRHTLGLRDVAYIIRADVELKAHATDVVAKYRDQFRRRVERGQCYHRPYLGCREFAADFGPLDGSEKPIEVTDDLGRMLLDQVFEPAVGGLASWRAHGGGGAHVVQGVVRPLFFLARLESGVLKVPRHLNQREG